MKKIVFILIVFLQSRHFYGQSVPPGYFSLRKKADSLYKAGDYKSSAFAYSEAFKINGWKGFVDDRYDAACAWALAGFPDSALFNIERIAYKAFYYNYDRIIKDSGLVALHNSQRWQPLLAKIKHNRDSIEAKIDRGLIRRLDKPGQSRSKMEKPQQEAGKRANA